MIKKGARAFNLPVALRSANFMRVPSAGYLLSLVGLAM